MNYWLRFQGKTYSYYVCQALYHSKWRHIFNIHYLYMSESKYLTQWVLHVDICLFSLPNHYSQFWHKVIFKADHLLRSKTNNNNNNNRLTTKRHLIWSHKYKWILYCLKMYKISHVHKLHRTENENLESGADSRRMKHRWNKYPKRHFPGRFTITLTIHNCHDATEPHTQKMRSRIQTQQIAREDQPPNVNGWH